MASAGFKKPPTSLGAPKAPPSAKFVLGSRPTSLRQKQTTPPKTTKAAPNTRDYGTKTPAATAIQPGNPMPDMGNPNGF
jgi:hypothetical protein